VTEMPSAGLEDVRVTAPQKPACNWGLNSAFAKEH
jgi:hypothetical protein